MKNSKKCLYAMVAFVVAAISCGCSSGRLSYRYGDGEPYDGVKGVDVRQKFRIRTLSFKEEAPEHSYFAKYQESLPEAHAVAAASPELFSTEGQTGEPQIDVTVRFGEMKISSGFWNSTLFLLSLSIFPIEVSVERTSTIEICDVHGEKIVPDATFTRFDDEHTSLVLPFGLIPYSPREGCQENVFGESIYRGYGPEGSNAFVRTVSRCLVQQLKTHAWDRITMPEVDFNVEGKK